jgi:hypothetical protein
VAAVRDKREDSKQEITDSRRTVMNDSDETEQAAKTKGQRAYSRQGGQTYSRHSRMHREVSHQITDKRHSRCRSENEAADAADADQKTRQQMQMQIRKRGSKDAEASEKRGNIFGITPPPTPA